MARLLKVGVLLKIPDKQQALPQLIEWDHEQNLPTLIETLCSRWSLANPDEYVVKFDKDGELLTDENLSKVQQGSVLHLAFKKWTKYASQLRDKLQGSENERLGAAKSLVECVQDSKFAVEFVAVGGVEVLMKRIESEKSESPVMTCCLRAFLAIMDQDLFSWNNITPKFIQAVVGLVSLNSATQSIEQLKACLEIIECFVSSREDSLALVESHITLEKLIIHLKNPDVEVAKNVLALISALLSRADSAKKKKLVSELYTRSVRSTIMNYVIQNSNARESTAHELYVLQRNCLNILEERCKIPIDLADVANRNWLNDLRKTLLDMGVDLSNQKPSDDTLIYKRLGFENLSSPLSDFSIVPPGMLAMDNIIYFGKNHPEDLTKVVLENSCRANEYDLPFIKACIELTKVLYKILDIGKKPSDEGTTYHPMLFNSENPFGELFSCCILLLNKTWKEMSAARVDFDKVFEVLKEQIIRSLQQMPTTSDQLKNILNSLPYAKIAEIWYVERKKKEEWESQAKPIQELRKKLEPEMLDLIKQHRLNYLVHGTHFPLPKTRSSAKFTYCRLTANHKTLCYTTECDETGEHYHDNLPNKLPVCEIKGLLTGTDCPHSKDKKIKIPSQYMFSILHEGAEDTLNFIAQSEEEVSIWTDGINALINCPMVSKLKDQHLEILLNMEVKLRLLDTEGLEIPKERPEIPPDPPNYDFAYDI